MKYLKLILVISLPIIIFTKEASADESQLGVYQVNNLNVNEQTASIVNSISQLKPNKVVIYYAGAMYFLANEVRAGITEQSSAVAIEMNALNPYYTYSTGQITVTLIGDTTQSQPITPEASESGNFFDYTNHEHSFFNQ